MSWTRFQGHIIEVRGVSGRCIVARDRKREKTKEIPAYVQISVRDRNRARRTIKFSDYEISEQEIIIHK